MMVSLSHTATLISLTTGEIKDTACANRYKQMEVKLLTLNEPTLNGNIYTTEAISKAIAEYVSKGKPMVVQRHFTQNRDVDLEKVCGVVENIECRGNELVGTVKVFPGEEALLALSVRPAFIGKINEDRTISDIELLSFNFTADPA